jgi:hypothetical protein
MVIDVLVSGRVASIVRLLPDNNALWNDHHNMYKTTLPAQSLEEVSFLIACSSRHTNIDAC